MRSYVQIPCGSLMACVLLLGLSTWPTLSAARVLAQSEIGSVAERANIHAAGISDADRYLAELDGHMRMARTGDYGRLQHSQIRRLESARARITSLLKGHHSALELEPNDRIALYNAQSTIESVLRNNDKDRVVCRREVTTGSRLPTTECLTVAEREARARTARASMDRLTRGVCFTSTSGDSREAHDCSK